jgi:hypothetical protein
MGGSGEMVCDNGCNRAEFEVHNGNEVQRLCEPSFADLLLDLVTHNISVTFADADYGEPFPNAVTWRRFPAVCFQQPEAARSGKE